MGASKGKAGTKSAQKSLGGDIRGSSGDIQEYNSRAPIASKSDPRTHPNPGVGQAIANLVFSGMTQDTICRVLKIGLDTLHTHYKHELETGQVSMVNDIAQSLAQRAKAGSDTAAIFLLKTRGGGKFSERQHLELSGNVDVTHKAELIGELSALLSRGITIDAEVEPVEEKKEGA